MQIAMIERATRVVGKGQGYLGLPLRDVVVDCPVGGPGVPAMLTAWTPTPAELAALNAGASVHVSIHGTMHPPIYVSVSEPPDPAP